MTTALGIIAFILFVHICLYWVVAKKDWADSLKQYRDGFEGLQAAMNLATTNAELMRKDIIVYQEAIKKWQEANKQLAGHLQDAQKKIQELTTELARLKGAN